MATNWSAMLVRIDNAISARVDGGVVDEYDVRGVNLKYATIGELTKLRDWVSRKSAASKGGPFAYGVPGRSGG